MKILNLVIVGFGGMGKYHVELLKPMEHIRAIGTYDIDEKQMVIGESMGLKPYKSLEAVLADRQVDLVLIATPNHTHKEIAIQALKANKHVICEKPVTLNSEELNEILSVCETSEGMFFVHQNRRWDEDFLVVKEVYNNKKIGEFVHVESRVQGSRGVPGDWRKEKEFGGGMMLDWGVHLLDQLLFMIKEPVQSLYCKLSNVRTNAVDDGFKLLLNFESGMTAEVEVGTYNYLTKPMWYVVGSEGALTIEDFWSMDGALKVYNHIDEADAKPIVAGAGLTKTMAPRPEELMTTLPVPRIDVDQCGFYRNVYESIQGNEKPIITHDQVQYVMKIMEAAFQSAEKNSVVELQ